MNHRASNHSAEPGGAAAAIVPHASRASSHFPAAAAVSPSPRTNARVLGCFRESTRYSATARSRASASCAAVHKNAAVSAAEACNDTDARSPMRDSSGSAFMSARAVASAARADSTAPVPPDSPAPLMARNRRSCDESTKRSPITPSFASCTRSSSRSLSAIAVWSRASAICIRRSVSSPLNGASSTSPAVTRLVSTSSVRSARSASGDAAESSTSIICRACADAFAAATASPVARRRSAASSGSAISTYRTPAASRCSPPGIARNNWYAIRAACRRDDRYCGSDCGTASSRSTSARLGVARACARRSSSAVVRSLSGTILM